MLLHFGSSKSIASSKVKLGVATLFVGLGVSTAAYADENDAKAMLKSMSDYVASQDQISFTFDADLEVITKNDQRLALVSSGEVSLKRPDSLYVSRSGGFAETETIFDGKTLTIFGKVKNIFVQVDAPSTFDELIAMLSQEFDRPPPAADLLLVDSYDQLMQGVTDIQDLGSGVVGGVECDFFAFRADHVDWQIWIAQGENPYPCRYVVTSQDIPGNPQYTIQFSNWATGSDAQIPAFTFENTTNATQIDAADVATKLSELPSHFEMGD